MSAREGWSEIECHCCGDVAAEGCWFPDGMALLCGCRGQISCDSETEPHVNVDDCDCEGRSVSERIAAARAEGRREAETALRRAVNEECDCGGAEYGKGCKACDVWHAYKARALSAPATTGTTSKCDVAGPHDHRYCLREAPTVGKRQGYFNGVCRECNRPSTVDSPVDDAHPWNHRRDCSRYLRNPAPPSPPKGGAPTCGGYMCNFPECPKHGTGTQWNAGRPRPESAEAKVCACCLGNADHGAGGCTCPEWCPNA